MRRLSMVGAAVMMLASGPPLSPAVERPKGSHPQAVEPQPAVAGHVGRRIAELQTGDVLTRQNAALTLRNIGGDAEPALPALIVAFGDEDERVRKWSREAVANLASDSHLPLLLKALNHDNSLIRKGAVQVLAEGKWEPRQTEAALLAALKDQASGVRIAAMEAVWKRAIPSAKVLPYLVNALGDNALGDKEANAARQRVCVYAVRYLGMMGAEGKGAVPALLRVLEGKDAELRFGSVYALGQIGVADQRVVRALAVALEDQESQNIRECAVWAIGQLGESAKEAIPGLVKALGSCMFKDPVDIRYSQFNTLKVLTRLGPAAKEAAPAVAQLVRDPAVHPLVRGCAAETLGAIRSTEECVMDALSEAMRDERPAVRLAARNAFALLQTHSPPR